MIQSNFKPWVRESDGQYFETENQPPNTVPCVERPTPYHSWVNGAWQFNLAAYQAAAIVQLRWKAHLANVSANKPPIPVAKNATETSVMNATDQATIDSILAAN